jgi:3-hydroxyisobutyrate dehydrogenase-like beta-hydroxyacid dehydrogenase
MREVSIVGLGIMGQALAKALLSSGFTVTVWNRTARKAKKLQSDGAKLAASVAEAIQASGITVFCISTHQDTLSLLNSAGVVLDGKSVIELSSGAPEDATELASYIELQGGRCLVGMILSYPSGIGSERASITTAGDEELWRESEEILSVLARNLSYISDDPKALATMFSALFISRQGYLFGMVYGALLFEKAGLPIQAYLDMLPQLNPLLQDYLDVVRTSVGSDNYSNPQASLETIRGAFDDALAPYKALNTRHDFPELMAEIVDQAIAAGFGGEQMTAILKVLR